MVLECPDRVSHLLVVFSYLPVRNSRAFDAPVFFTQENILGVIRNGFVQVPAIRGSDATLIQKTRLLDAIIFRLGDIELGEETHAEGTVIQMRKQSQATGTRRFRNCRVDLIYSGINQEFLNFLNLIVIIIFPYKKR